MYLVTQTAIQKQQQGQNVQGMTPLSLDYCPHIGAE